MYQKSGVVVLDDYSEEVCTWLARQAGVSRERYIRDLLKREESACDKSNKEMTIESLYKKINFEFSMVDEKFDMILERLDWLLSQNEDNDDD